MPNKVSSPPGSSKKLPKFLSSKGRDRSKSEASASSPTQTQSPLPTPSSSSSFLPETPLRRKSTTKVQLPPDTTRQEKKQESSDRLSVVDPHSPQPRPRTRSERPMAEYPSTNLPARLSGWFSHTFSTSSNDLSLPTLLSQASPKAKGAGSSSSALLTAAKHGRGHLDKAVRYLLDSDSTPDRCADPIWLLGVEHPGYEPPPVDLRASVDSRRSPSSFRSSSSSSSDLTKSQSKTPQQPPHPSSNWPPVFYEDYTSRVWLTYRSHFQPIRDSNLHALDSDTSVSVVASSSPPTKRWNWGGEKGWTSDSGWGCMLRTGQSLLANALIHMHLGRDWRRPPHSIQTADYATYVQIITWFLDTPSPQAPFSVHRMALAGKELGKDVGQWFGPSTAAGAIKTLVHSFPDARLGVSVASDSVVFQSDVLAASNGHLGSYGHTSRRVQWGDRAVLVLIGLRLGLDGVNPIYYETIKALYTFPQSVGIAGGRPSSSYYFVGSQADNLFYLDPHHARPAVPLRPTPAPGSSSRFERETTPERKPTPEPAKHRSSTPTSPSSVRTGSSQFSYHAPMSPSPLQQQFSSSSDASTSQDSSNSSSSTGSKSQFQNTGEMDEREFGLGAGASTLDPVQEHYTSAYSTAELKTFHCDRVRKMPLSGLDPSMLLGFLCKDEADWLDFRARVTALSRDHKTIFSVQDEPPTWPSDSDDCMGLESISEPDDMDIDMPEEEETFFDSRSSSGRGSSISPDASSQDHDTEEDPIDPITPGPTRTTFNASLPSKDDESFDSGDIEDDWVDPVSPTSIASPPAAPPVVNVLAPSPAITKTKSSGSSSSAEAGKKKSRKTRKSAGNGVSSVKIPSPPLEQHYPFPVTQRLPEEGERVANRMHTGKARDGGRTQSGGVRGVLD